MTTSTKTISTFVSEDFYNAFDAYLNKNKVKAANVARDAIAAAIGYDVQKFYKSVETSKAARKAARIAEREAKRIAAEKAAAEKAEHDAKVAALAASIGADKLAELLAELESRKAAEVQSVETANA